MTNQITEFNPKKEELLLLVDKYKGLKINGVEDKDGYQAVVVARKELKAARVEIQKTGKALREDAVARQKAIIGLEKDLIELIEPTEKELELMEDEYEEMKEVKKREALLPERLAKLVELGITTNDEVAICKMDSEQFMTYFMNTKMAIIEEQNRKMLAEQAKIEQAKKELEQAQANEAQRIKDAENAKVNQRKLSLAQYHQFADSESLKTMSDIEFDILLENSKIAYNEKKQQELEKVRVEVLEKAQKDLAELEKVRVEALEKAQRDLAEQQRIKAEQEAKAKANAEAKEKLDQEKLEKEKKYKKWLKDNEGFYDELKRDGNKVILYKIISEFIIN